MGTNTLRTAGDIMNIIPTVDEKLLKSLLRNQRYWCDICKKTFETEKAHHLHQKLDHPYVA
jgi:transposase-like protein